MKPLKKKAGRCRQEAEFNRIEQATAAGGQDGRRQLQGKGLRAKGDNGVKQGETGAVKGGNEPKKQQVPSSDSKTIGKPQIEEKLEPTDDPAKQEELQKKREEYLKKLEEEMRKNGQFKEKAWQDFLKEKGDKVSPPDISAKKERPPFVPNENLLGREDEPANPPKNPADDQATMLQLRKLTEAIDKKALEKAGLTPDQWRDFLKNYSEKAMRQDPTAQENPAAPQNSGKLSGARRHAHQSRGANQRLE